MELNAVERRVLGVLMEKAMSQPDYYPMTVNAIVTGCNQRSNRHPVMTLDDTAVADTLEVLRGRKLTAMVLPAPGARTHRYKHEVEAATGWSKRQQAIMAELLLRGPQTPGELRSRCARMFQFESLESVTIALESLARPEEGEPVVEAMAREPGQSAVRFRHLLYPPDEVPAGETAEVHASPAPAAPARDVVAELRGEIEQLREELADLRRRTEVLEERTDGL